MCHSQIRHPQKTARTCGAALIFPYKSILSPLHHLALSSLNSLQCVSILLGPSCVKVNTPFQRSELSPPPREFHAGLWQRAEPKMARLQFPKGPFLSVPRADCSLFLVSDCQAAALESLWSHYIVRKVTLLVMCGCIDR